ncbi:hypothetical protein K469DRAFT_329236 [Zopfia rhizophila CBS 207.26]|uniref:Uncharacterized protein n=1 Tax=Zopfia rhizophila CBS 207.26 TaxID=1314779 RepID=A0A6A6DHZ1_9PEZI|nr:hypothetical protein K469DRAFT_329236 [Zopfia rhizophila CBS 207.26]
MLVCCQFLPTSFCTSTFSEISCHHLVKKSAPPVARRRNRLRRRPLIASKRRWRRPVPRRGSQCCRPVITHHTHFQPHRREDLFLSPCLSILAPNIPAHLGQPFIQLPDLCIPDPLPHVSESVSKRFNPLSALGSHFRSSPLLILYCFQPSLDAVLPSPFPPLWPKSPSLTNGVHVR